SPMARISSILPVSDLRRDASLALKSLKESGQPLVITQRGRAAAVIMSIEAYQRSEVEREMLLMLARGEKEISRNKGVDLDVLMAEADKLLSDARRS
ncbi:MAG: type II toxin-antitoxin system Phd/YefM family antitoxin, partial [Myxococcota bacterium]|nr:type II toxin-antitoxin system Phd/YefM family antitoxin [Myxococcota bacterium]